MTRTKAQLEAEVEALQEELADMAQRLAGQTDGRPRLVLSRGAPARDVRLAEDGTRYDCEVILDPSGMKHPAEAADCLRRVALALEQRGRELVQGWAR